jgi:hypothetical protein
MGWTRASSPKRRAVSWNTNPPIMAAMPSSQAGWRASRTMSRPSNPATGPVFRAPARWHTDAVAVHRLAATASKIAFSMYFSVSAAPGRANGAIRRFLVGLAPGTPGM